MKKRYNSFRNIFSKIKRREEITDDDFDKLFYVWLSISLTLLFLFCMMNAYTVFELSSQTERELIKIEKHIGMINESVKYCMGDMCTYNYTEFSNLNLSTQNE